MSLLELFKSYISGYKVFAVIHAILFLWFIIQWIKNRKKLIDPKKETDRFKTATDHLLELLSTEVYSSVEQAIDRFINPFKTEIDGFTKYANIFLLIGVIGTLIGLYQGVSGAINANVKVDLPEILSHGFGAFGVTAVSVFLSILVIFFQSLSAKKIGILEQKLYEMIETSGFSRGSEAKAKSALVKGIKELALKIDGFVESAKGLESVVQQHGNIQDIINEMNSTLKELSNTVKSVPKAVDTAQTTYLSTVTKNQEQYETSLKNLLNEADKVATSTSISLKTIENNLNQMQEKSNATIKAQIEQFKTIIATLTQGMPQAKGEVEIFRQIFLKTMGEIIPVLKEFINQTQRASNTMGKISKTGFSESFSSGREKSYQKGQNNLFYSFQKIPLTLWLPLCVGTLCLGVFLESAYLIVSISAIFLLWILAKVYFNKRYEEEESYYMSKSKSETPEGIFPRPHMKEPSVPVTPINVSKDTLTKQPIDVASNPQSEKLEVSQKTIQDQTKKGLDFTKLEALKIEALKKLKENKQEKNS